MIAADDLIALIRNYNPKTNETLIRKAYTFGNEMHDGQFRHSGEPYFSHPIAVAAILTEQHLDDSTLITALLHDEISRARCAASITNSKRLGTLSTQSSTVTRAMKRSSHQIRVRSAVFRGLLLVLQPDNQRGTTASRSGIGKASSISLTLKLRTG